jgi:regulator of sigma E protease
MVILQYVIALIVVLGVLVSVHEYGHYIVARACGVRVLRFSVGMGPVIFSRRDARGCEFALSALPIGGYVRMLDEREGSVPPEQRHEAFNVKTPWQRIAISLGGPVANFLLAIVVYWLVFVGTGVSGFTPVTGPAPEGTPAAVAGLPADHEITAVDGEAVDTWQAVSIALVDRLGETGTIRISARPVAGGAAGEFGLPIERWLAGENDPDLLTELGIVPRLPALLGSVLDDGPAAAAGLRKGDLVSAVDDETVGGWSEFVRMVRAAPERRVEIEYLRGGVTRSLYLTPAVRTLEDGTEIGYVGVGPLYSVIRHGPIEAVPLALAETASRTTMTLDLLGKMVAGLVSTRNLSGPITIAKVAGDSAELGMEQFLKLLALLSVSLGVLNLLPIPVLDGGHILFYLVELVRGSPVPERVQIMGVQIGIFIVASLMLLALFNDLTRFL